MCGGKNCSSRTYPSMSTITRISALRIGGGGSPVSPFRSEPLLSAQAVERRTVSSVPHPLGRGMPSSIRRLRETRNGSQELGRAQSSQLVAGVRCQLAQRDLRGYLIAKSDPGSWT
jgi:hypothetical protein